MEKFKVIIRGEENHVYELEVFALNADQAMDKAFEDFSGDILEAWCEDLYFC